MDAASASTPLITAWNREGKPLSARVSSNRGLGKRCANGVQRALLVGDSGLSKNAEQFIHHCRRNESRVPARIKGRRHLHYICTHESDSPEHPNQRLTLSRGSASNLSELRELVSLSPVTLITQRF